MKIIPFDRVKERVFEWKTPSNTTIRVLSKPDFYEKNVFLKIPFGAIHQQVLLQDETRKTFPKGIAHFLEHMIFENTEKDVSREFALLGASVNAYTSPNETVYYFSTTDDIIKPLMLLLETVFQATFAEEHVQKERKIISSEIQMYQDDLEQSLYYEVMKHLYSNHPIRDDIAGTKASIEQIDSSMLETYYQLHYHPSMCSIIISGDVDVDKIQSALSSTLLGTVYNSPELKQSLYFGVRMKKETTPFIQKTKDVNSALWMKGYRIPMRLFEGRNIAEDELRLILYLDHFFAKGSDFHEQLLKKQLINNSFDFSVTIEDNYAHILFFTETKNPLATSKAITGYLTSIEPNMISKRQLDRQIRKLQGEFVQIFNSPKDGAALILDYEDKGIHLESLLAWIESLGRNDLAISKKWLEEAKTAEVVYVSKNMV